ncbi:WXG100 family type VII secretion target [Mycolicibacterium lutetiense]|uniref:WXG100 family type VII secretion target n=1 Tax=Mycolicibacterium lutetiense TaxID=1641992 RepID=A0ABS5A046_9MYCO|nr:WXG100 family type VII secretion target [Mycolicibacterium lutetiense]MBP2455137.1 WXG100 family type VII secretion target [Mycolicibacterium lutetiense]
MAGYTVDVDALHDLQEQMQHFLTRATESLAHVEGLIAQVCADWDGTAAAAYQRRHREWVDALRDMNDSIADFRAWTGAAEEGYREVMEINLRMAQG